MIFLAAGLSSESEASAAQVAALIKQIKADGVHTGLWRISLTRGWWLNRQPARSPAENSILDEALARSRGWRADNYQMMRHNVALIAASMKEVIVRFLIGAAGMIHLDVPS